MESARVGHAAADMVAPGDLPNGHALPDFVADDAEQPVLAGCPGFIGQPPPARALPSPPASRRRASALSARQPLWENLTPDRNKSVVDGVDIRHRVG